MKSVKKCKTCSTKMLQNGSGKLFFHRKSIFRRFLIPPSVPKWAPGRPRSRPEAFQLFFDFPFCLKTGFDRAPGGPGEVPGHPQTPASDHFGAIFGRFLKQEPTNKKQVLAKFPSALLPPSLFNFTNLSLSKLSSPSCPPILQASKHPRWARRNARSV